MCNAEYSIHTVTPRAKSWLAKNSWRDYHQTLMEEVAYVSRQRLWTRPYRFVGSEQAELASSCTKRWHVKVCFIQMMGTQAHSTGNEAPIWAMHRVHHMGCGALVHAL